MPQTDIKGIYGTSAKPAPAQRQTTPAPLDARPAGVGAGDEVVALLTQIRDEARAHHRRMRDVWVLGVVVALIVAAYCVLTLAGGARRASDGGGELDREMRQFEQPRVTRPTAPLR